MERFWITGISRGIGAALAKALAAPGREIIGLSRSLDEDLAARIRESGADFRHISIDLTDTEALRKRAPEIFPRATEARLLCLINNAGTLGALTAVGQLGDSVERTVGLNSIALFVLSDLFAEAYQDTRGGKTIVNITSGAAVRAMSGASLYCATKASVDMFTRTMGLEQESQLLPITVVAVSPGMVETGMQKAIRERSADEMPLSDFFREAQATGKVRPADEVAEKLIRNLFLDHENGSVLHIRDLQ